jgi:hypothetical protein
MKPPAWTMVRTSNCYEFHRPPTSTLRVFAHTNARGVNAHCHGSQRWHCVGMPVTALLFQYIIWRAALKTLRNDGVDWRGTHYSLKELKANKV